MLWTLIITLAFLAAAVHARVRARRYQHELEHRADAAPASFVRGLVSTSASPSRLVIEARRAHRHGATLHIAVGVVETSEQTADESLDTVCDIGAAVLPMQLGFHWDTHTVVMASVEPLADLPGGARTTWTRHELGADDDLSLEAVEQRWGRAG